MKVKKATHNNRKKAFELTTAKGTFAFPYAKADPRPKAGNYVTEVYVDKELGNEAFTYILESGKEGSIHIDHVLEYNQEPEYMKDLFLYNLTVAVRKHIDKSPISKRELIRRLGTSAAQLYRLLEPSNSHKSIAQLLTILHLLDCEVELIIKDREGRHVVECIA